MGYAVMESPIGPLTIVSQPAGLQAIRFGLRVPDKAVEDSMQNARVLSQLEEYFGGIRQSFDLPLALTGTPFQKAVWKSLLEIPFGETRSYGDLARAIGRPGAARAVGMANHANPIPIVIPCHRVIGHDRSLTGYGGGLQIKARLLELEGAPNLERSWAASGHPRGRSTPLAHTAR